MINVVGLAVVYTSIAISGYTIKILLGVVYKNVI